MTSQPVGESPTSDLEKLKQIWGFPQCDYPGAGCPTPPDPDGATCCAEAERFWKTAAALSAVRKESENEIAALHVLLKRADGALADAATVPTSDGVTWNVEPGIRALTAERDALRGLLLESKRLATALEHAYTGCCQDNSEACEHGPFGGDLRGLKDEWRELAAKIEAALAEGTKP